MAYREVDFEAKREEVAETIEEAKRVNSYDPAGFDPMVLSALNEVVDEAEQIAKDYFHKVDGHQAAAKQAMAELEALVQKGNDLDKDDLPLIDTIERNLRRFEQAATAVYNEGGAALDQFRKGWEDRWRPLASNPNKLNPWIAKRQQWVADHNKKYADIERMREYEKRAAELKKAAQQLATKGGQLRKQETQTIDQFKAAVQKATRELDIAVTRVEGELALFKAVPPRQKPDAATLKALQQAITKSSVSSKKIRGSLKTLQTQINAFQKIGTQFKSRSNRKAAEKAYTTAVQAFTARQAKVEALTHTEADCTKLLATVSKLK